MNKEKLSINPAETIGEEVRSWDRMRSAEELRKFVLGRLEAIRDTEDLLV